MNTKTEKPKSFGPKTVKPKIPMPPSFRVTSCLCKRIKLSAWFSTLSRTPRAETFLLKLISLTVKQLFVITVYNINSQNYFAALTHWRKMSNLGDLVADDKVELVDDEQAGIKYRLRKCGKCRLIVISLILCVIGAAVALAVILTRGM